MKRWQIFLGVGLIFLGILIILDTIFSINIWGILGPLLLIGLGLLIILRPRKVDTNTDFVMAFIKDDHKKGIWLVKSQETWCFVGSHKLDFTEAEIPEGVSIIKIYAFVEDLKVISPPNLGVEIQTNGIYSELKSPIGKKEQFFGELDFYSENYQESNKKIVIAIHAIVSEVVIKHSLI
jgi:predicted membrane protein